MATEQDYGPNRGRGVSRRTFLSAGAAGGTALLGGGFGLASLLSAPARATSHDPIWIERTIPELQALMIPARCPAAI